MISMVIKECIVCGKEFETNRDWQICCSKKCSKKRIKEYNKQWREENKEHLKEYEKQRYKKNKEKRRECHKQWCEKNKEDVNACVGSSGNEENKNIRVKYGHRRNHKMSFRTIDVTAPELLNYCLNGHSFCNLFAGFPCKGWNDRGGAVTYIKTDGSFTLSAKKNEYFYGSNAICIDIDSTAAPTIQDYVDRLSHKPTFWYTTFSHMEPGRGNRFRMVYALAEPIIGQQQFDAVVDQVHRRIECEVGEVIEDKCGEKCSQYFNGTNVKNNELVVEYKYYGCIYCIKDIYNNVIERENNITTTNYPSWQTELSQNQVFHYLYLFEFLQDSHQVHLVLLI